VGTPEEVFHRPNSSFVADFAGAENKFPVKASFRKGEVRLAARRLEHTAKLPLPGAGGKEGVNAPIPVEGAVDAHCNYSRIHRLQGNSFVQRTAPAAFS